jgi:hypothetical protein
MTPRAGTLRRVLWFGGGYPQNPPSPKRRQARPRIETAPTAMAMTTSLTLGPRSESIEAPGDADSICEAMRWKWIVEL